MNTVYLSKYNINNKDKKRTDFNRVLSTAVASNRPGGKAKLNVDLRWRAHRCMLWIDPLLPDSVEGFCSQGNVFQEHIGLHNAVTFLVMLKQTTQPVKLNFLGHEKEVARHSVELTFRMLFLDVPAASSCSSSACRT